MPHQGVLPKLNAQPPSLIADRCQLNAALNIANVTDPLPGNLKLGWLTGGCPRETSSSSKSAQRPIVHRLDPAVALNSKMVLVDPEKQAVIVRQNDPQKLIMSAIDDHQPVSNNDLDT